MVIKTRHIFIAKLIPAEEGTPTRGLEDEHGCWKNSDEDFKVIVVRYFGDLFSSTKPDASDIKL